MSSGQGEADWPLGIDDADLERLDRFLRAHAGEDDLLLDGVHGLLTAIALMLLPFLIFVVLVKILPPWQESEAHKA